MAGLNTVIFVGTFAALIAWSVWYVARAKRAKST